MEQIIIAEDFSRFPGGRYRSKGKYSGEEFREDRLLPVLANDEALVVILDGTEGYGSSFLEEAFGGLVRAGISVATLKKRLKPVAKSSGFQSFVDEIWQYIDEEGSRQALVV